MRYDFDKVIDRGPSSGSFSSKWEGYEGRFPGYQIDTGKALSMWVADMDFRYLRLSQRACKRRVS